MQNVQMLSYYIYKNIYLLLELVSLAKVIIRMIRQSVLALVNKLTVLAQWDITMIPQQRNAKNVNLIA